MRGGKYLSDRKQIISRIGEADAILMVPATGCPLRRGCICLRITGRLKNCLEI